MKQTNIKFLLTFALITLIFTGASCNTNKNSSPANTNNNQVTTNQNTITIKNFAFAPQELTISANQEVTFINNDSTTHTVTFSSFDSGDLKPGESFKHTFSTAGTYSFHCSIHPYMQGKVIVQ
ncbi:MAG: cupredoxin family copper-binding protein [Patescibacteria group bacterium]|nr:cupredoxin family copper-binding protein [Patescibacteria group bacterium]